MKKQNTMQMAIGGTMIVAAAALAMEGFEKGSVPVMVLAACLAIAGAVVIAFARGK